MVICTLAALKTSSRKNETEKNVYMIGVFKYARRKTRTEKKKKWEIGK